LLKVIYKVYGKRYLFAGIFFFIELFVQLFQGYFLAEFLSWISNSSEFSQDGYYYATGIIITGMMYTILHHAEWFICASSGMRVRVGLIAAIYQKCLNLSLADTSSTGLVINLVSNDVQRFEDCAPFLHYLWITPLQMIGFMTLIYYQIGYSVFAAVGSLLLLLAIQYSFSPVFKKYRKLTVALRDERIKTLSDMISGISVVKLYAWEIPFMKKISELRKSELKYIWSANKFKSINEAIYFLSHILINGITFTTFVWIGGGELTAARVFSTIIYLSALKLSVTRFVPACAQFIPEAMVSAHRIESFLSLPDSELPDDAFRAYSEGPIIDIKNATFSWDSAGCESRKATLKNISLKVNAGELVMIVGKVGSAKSSLLSAILHDMYLMEGKVSLTTRKFAFVSQTAFIHSGTIRENIIFGKEYNHEKFFNAISVCALQRDLELFPKGENTFIGERGVTLSGGQRARVSLARAVYAEADIYLLDDPLAAVDSKVGRHLFEKCIQGALKDSTVLLVTHQMQYLSKADKVVVMMDGEISLQGSYREILNSETIASILLKRDNPDEENKSNNEELREKINGLEHSSKLQEANLKNEVFAKEDMFTGAVTWETYFQFFRAGTGNYLSTFLAFLLLFAQALGVYSDFWLSNWSAVPFSNQKNAFFTLVFVVLVIGTIILVLFRSFLFFYICIKSSKVSFEKMLKSVFNSPMSFFQSNPHGRTMNRFSKDINIMDETLPQTFFDLLQCIFYFFAVLAVCVIVIPYLLIIIPFLGYAFYKLRMYYMQTARQVKRLEAISRSPVYSSIPSTLEGISVIRAFGAKERFRLEFFAHQDENTRMFFSFLSGSRWLAFRLDGLVSLIIGCVVFLVVALRTRLNISAGFMGVLISYLMQLTGLLQWIVRQSSEVENMMVSAERIFEYSKLPQEEEHLKSFSPPSDWPSSGKLVLDKMSLTYPNIQDIHGSGTLVLKELELTIPPGTKVGIVGRTGNKFF
jgi:ATP-binding cassette subfamily C (CFTR/MRP) protein 4